MCPSSPSVLHGLWVVWEGSHCSEPSPESCPCYAFCMFKVLYAKAYQFQAWLDLHSVCASIVTKWIVNLLLRGLCCWCLASGASFGSGMPFDSAHCCVITLGPTHTWPHADWNGLARVGLGGVSSIAASSQAASFLLQTLIQVFQGTCQKIALTAGVTIPQQWFPHTFLTDLTLGPHDGVKILNHSLQHCPLSNTRRAKHPFRGAADAFYRQMGLGCILQPWNRNKLTGT